MPTGNSASTDLREIRHFHLFCGLGGAARGFNRGSARIGNMTATARACDEIRVDQAACVHAGSAQQKTMSAGRVTLQHAFDVVIAVGRLLPLAGA